MVFNTGESIGLGIIVLWLGIVTFFVIKMLSHYNRLTRGVTNTGLREVLESLLQEKRSVDKRLKDVDETLRLVRREGDYHIQRIGIVRFNPFSDTGGAQSFTIAVLDGANNGVVMTTLYARAGNRWYMKEILAGKGKGVELSKEEEAAIHKAGLGKVSSHG